MDFAIHKIDRLMNADVSFINCEPFDVNSALNAGYSSVVNMSWEFLRNPQRVSAIMEKEGFKLFDIVSSNDEKQYIYRRLGETFSVERGINNVDGKIVFDLITKNKAEEIVDMRNFEIDPDDNKNNDDLMVEHFGHILKKLETITSEDEKPNLIFHGSISWKNYFSNNVKS